MKIKYMARSGMIKRFVLVWVIYWTLYAIQPVSSIYTNITQAFILQISFVIMTVIFFVLGSSYNGRAMSSANINIEFFDTKISYLAIRYGIIISIIGLAFLMYDKIYVQRIDYSQGLALARQEWRVLGEERESASSSIFSATGYLFGGAYFISLALLLSRLVKLSDSRRAIGLTLCAILLITNSALTGGRSSILLAIVFGCFGFFTKSTNMKGESLFKNNTLNQYFKILLLLGLVYVLQVFYSRSLASDQFVGAYSLAFLEYLGFVPLNWFVHIAYETDWGAALSLLNLAVSYLTHSLSTTAAILSTPHQSGDALFVNFMQIGAKFGIFSQPTDWFMGGRFASFPGALYFQYGTSGVVIGAAICGIVSGALSRAFSRNHNGILLFFLCSMAELILLMSPFLFAAEFLFFPSVVIGGFLTIFLARLRSR
jgi:oligosaccharide repeat unit polymerase